MNLVEFYNPFIKDGIAVTHEGCPLIHEVYQSYLYAWRFKGPKKYMYYIKKHRGGRYRDTVVDGKLLRNMILNYVPEEGTIIIADISSFPQHIRLEACSKIIDYMQKHTGEDWSKCLVTGVEPIV